MEECGLAHLQELPKFRPPDLHSPLPVPESPEPTPVPLTNLVVSLPFSIEQDSVLNSCQESSDPDVVFANWPQVLCKIQSNNEDIGIWNDAHNQSQCSQTHNIVSPGLSNSDWESDHLTESSHSSQYSYSSGDEEGCPATLRNGELSVSAPAEVIIADSAHEHDELCDTILVFPQVALGAVLAINHASMAMAPSPSDVPMPFGLSCCRLAVGLGSKSLSSPPQRQEVLPDYSEFSSWHLPVPGSPDPTLPAMHKP